MCTTLRCFLPLLLTVRPTSEAGTSTCGISCTSLHRGLRRFYTVECEGYIDFLSRHVSPRINKKLILSCTLTHTCSCRWCFAAQVRCCSWWQLPSETRELHFVRAVSAGAAMEDEWYSGGGDPTNGVGGAIAGSGGATYGDSFTPPTSQGRLASQQVSGYCNHGAAGLSAQSEPLSRCSSK